MDADKVCHSDMDFFIVTYSLTDHQELELKASDLDKDELCDMLLASAYLPAFRLEKLGGKYYADGGVQDVVPIHALVEKRLQGTSSPCASSASALKSASAFRTTCT